MLVQVRPQFNHSRYIHHVYGGRGFGSMFGRLFAKIAGRAARTGIRSAIKVGSKIITDADFKNLDFGTFYTDLQNFRSNYLQIDPLINECGINPLRFKNLCTIYAFDLTKHERDIRGDVVNSRLEVKFSTQTEAHIKAYACLISEKEIFLKSDGSNMVIR